MSHKWRLLDIHERLVSILFTTLLVVFLTYIYNELKVPVYESVQQEHGFELVMLSPQKTRNLLCALVVGLVLGHGLFLATRHLRVRIQTEGDVERCLKLAVLGVIPKET